MKFQSAHILQTYFEKLKEEDGFSLRQWSSIVGLSPTYLSLVLRSKRFPRAEMVVKIGRSLQMDRLALAELEEAHKLDWIKLKKIRLPDRLRKTTTTKLIPSVEVTLMEDAEVLRSWLNLALAEFTLCENFSEDVDALARIFSVRTEDIKQSLYWLLSSGFLLRDENGRLRKKSTKIRFPTSPRSRELIRDFHRQMIKKALAHMERQTDRESFERRLITGYTISVDPSQIGEAQTMIEKSLVEIAERISNGACTQVYQLQVQFFPLSAKT